MSDDEQTPDPTRAALVERIRAFILEKVEEETKSSRCCVFRLVHVADDGRHTSRTQAIADDVKGLATVGVERRQALAERFASKLCEAAVEIAGEYTRRQSFAVAAYPTAAREEVPLDELRFHIDRAGDAPLDELDSADPKIVIANLARIIESKEREGRIRDKDARDYMLSVADKMKAILDTTLSRNEFLERQLPEYFGNLQRALNEQTSRELASYVGHMQADRHERWWRLAEKEVPKVVDQLAGLGPLGQLVREIKALPREDRQKLVMVASAMPPTIRAVLMEALDLHILDGKLLERKASAVESVAAAGTNGTPTGQNEGGSS